MTDAEPEIEGFVINLYSFLFLLLHFFFTDVDKSNFQGIYDLAFLTLNALFYPAPKIGKAPIVCLV